MNAEQQRDALLFALEGLVERHSLFRATGPTEAHFADALTVARFVIGDVKAATQAS